ncbi:rhamnulokinase [Dactylosporangium sp. CA-052675]|uniref:rhamnulokinase n=1 Tax=Dactylosporangium sp. CA-052675 TaxID=3239927 RepID=UPI003D92026A
MRIAAVDLGASNGRVIVGDVTSSSLTFAEVARFANDPIRVGGVLSWDFEALYRGVLDGLAAAGPLDSVGIDSWAVDYGLLDERGALLGQPVHYRDARTDGVADRFDGYALYRASGIAPLPFNTIFQLAAARGSEQLEAARTLLLVPDLLSYRLTGVAGTELTNASTTGLLAAGGGSGWSPGLLSLAGVDAALFPPLRAPGTLAGTIKTSVGVSPGTPVTVVASHDTASAVAGVPGAGNFAYISCGTWSLVGVELPAPVLTRDSYEAGFTNEIGVDGTVRYLRNVMGLWLLQECMREWSLPLAGLLAGAAAAPGGRSVVDATDPAFLAPGDMPARIAAACRAAQQPVPSTPAEMTRCILDSLALAYRRAIDDARRLAGVTVDVVHMVGGGALNTLLCQLTADACGLPVLAGPVEAGALGNILVQARALGVLDPDLAAMRDLVRSTQPIVRYTPRA